MKICKLCSIDECKDLLCTKCYDEFVTYSKRWLDGGVTENDLNTWLTARLNVYAKRILDGKSISRCSAIVPHGVLGSGRPGRCSNFAEIGSTTCHWHSNLKPRQIQKGLLEKYAELLIQELYSTEEVL